MKPNMLALPMMVRDQSHAITGKSKTIQKDTRASVRLGWCRRDNQGWRVGKYPVEHFPPNLECFAATAIWGEHHMTVEHARSPDFENRRRAFAIGEKYPVQRVERGILEIDWRVTLDVLANRRADTRDVGYPVMRAGIESPVDHDTVALTRVPTTTVAAITPTCLSARIALTCACAVVRSPLSSTIWATVSA